jgi:hypothetical protein
MQIREKTTNLERDKLKGRWLVILVVQLIVSVSLQAQVPDIRAKTSSECNTSPSNFKHMAAWSKKGIGLFRDRLDMLLHEAAACNDLGSVAILLKAGANPYFLDSKGQTAFNRAASNGLQALALMTEEAFHDTQRPSGQKKWEEHGLNTPSGIYGSTLITYAAKVCCLSLIKEMINSGADITIVNGSGWTLLHCAAVMPNREEVLSELVQAFKNQGYSSMINMKSTHAYETSYNGHEVFFAEGLTAVDLCLRRLKEDPECPKELNKYQQILLN